LGVAAGSTRASLFEFQQMTIELAILLVAIPAFWAFAEWRLGLLLCLVTAILQDPLRKLTPDQPVLFVGLVVVVFGAACVGAWARGVSLGPNSIFSRYWQFAMPSALLVLLIIAQAFNSYLRFNNPIMPLIGLLTYVMPLPSIVLAYQLVSRQGEFRIIQFMKWYIVCISLTLTTVYLEFSGYHLPVLGQVGPKFIVFDQFTGVALLSSAGLFRASEIAAWHSMTAACFVVLLIFLRRTNFTRLLTAAIVVALLIGVGVLTGRRKIVIEFAVFVSTYFVLWAILEKGAGRLVVIAMMTVAVIVNTTFAAGLRDNVPQLIAIEKDSAEYSSYVRRSQAVFQDAPSRFLVVGMAPIMWAYSSFGLFGGGLGVGTQGTQYFGGGGANAGPAEGGLGKITLELGIPGLFVIGWIGFLFLRYVWRVIRVTSQYSPKLARLTIGLFSFLVANVAGFSVATQAYGDLFILLILSWTLGFLLAVPVLLERDVCARQPAIYEELAPIPA
jgi:hypothetical protein